MVAVTEQIPPPVGVRIDPLIVQGPEFAAYVTVPFVEPPVTPKVKLLPNVAVVVESVSV